MDRLGLTNKKAAAVLLTIAVAAFISGFFKNYIFADNLAAVLYCTLFIAWGLMVRRRILDAHIRKRLLHICGFMVGLFVLRVSRFTFFDDDAFMSIFLWYAYYIPMTAIPLLSFMVAINTEPIKNRSSVRIYERTLIICELILIAVVMTNSAHNLVFKVYDDMGSDYTRNWFYYIILVWMVILILGALAILLRKCALSSVRKLWFVPFICLFAGYALLLWYLAAGGSPEINGIKLFHLQEAFCFPFITVFESAIQIRLLPANTGYELLFDYSGIDAAICDADGRSILTSRNWIPNAGDADHQLLKENISGGYVNWVHDMTAINKLNSDLEEVTEELEEENDLIRQENEIRAERVSFETKNRLYNSIAKAVRPKALKVKELLDGDYDEEKSREQYIYAAFLSAFLKRMGNLMLISDEGGKVSTAELRMAIRESMDYMILNDISCDIVENGVKDLPSSFIIFTYDLFEQLMEDTWNSLHSCFVMFEDNDLFEITIALDSQEFSVTPEWRKKELAEKGIRLSVRSEDETFYITASCLLGRCEEFSGREEVGA